MQSRRHNRSRWAHCNTPSALRRRRAAADARREAVASTMPPASSGPEPLTLWQRITIDLYVPTSGRCDQHAAVIDGHEVGLLSASEVGVFVRKAILKRPSLHVLAESRRDCWASGT